MPAPGVQLRDEAGKHFRIGVISDTHGLLRPEVCSALAGVRAILHAGDVGEAAAAQPAILDVLRTIAPVTAIRGNIDRDGANAKLPPTEYVTLAEQNLYMLHDVHALDLDPSAAGIAAVIYGHSHKPSIEWRKGVLYFNPGAAGPRRFSLPISIGMLTISANTLMPALITL